MNDVQSEFIYVDGTGHCYDLLGQQFTGPDNVVKLRKQVFTAANLCCYCIHEIQSILERYASTI